MKSKRTLPVLPGSNTSDTGRFREVVVGWDGLNDGYWAMARIRPVPGCMITTEQLSARVRSRPTELEWISRPRPKYARTAPRSRGRIGVRPA